MHPLKATSLILLASAITATAAPDFALVRVTDILLALPSTTHLQQEIKKERDEIMKDERAEQLQKILTELQTLHTQLSDKNNPLDETTGRKLARSYELKRQEAQTLQQELESFKTEQEEVINEKMAAGTRASLDQIVKISNKTAKEKGFDLVFDSSGNTNTGIPLILYAKKTPDLTEDVRAALQENEAAQKPVEKTATKP